MNSKKEIRTDIKKEGNKERTTEDKKEQHTEINN